MFYNATNFFFLLERNILNKSLISAEHFLFVWDKFYIEWFLLQTVITYTFIRMVITKNYFKQLTQLLLLLIFLGCYISLMQLELFACFMFIAEFTIVIFFYTMFLHLKISVNQRETQKTLLGSAPATVLLLLLWSVLLSNVRSFFGLELNLVFIDVYSKTINFALNDLNFFFYTITRNNLSVHFLIGLLLLFLTIFLFLAVNVYYFLNISKKDAHTASTNKLAVVKGYYEQTAEFVQKILTNASKK